MQASYITQQVIMEFKQGHGSPLMEVMTKIINNLLPTEILSS